MYTVLCRSGGARNGCPTAASLEVPGARHLAQQPIKSEASLTDAHVPQVCGRTLRLLANAHSALENSVYWCDQKSAACLVCACRVGGSGREACLVHLGSRRLRSQALFPCPFPAHTPCYLCLKAVGGVPAPERHVCNNLFKRQCIKQHRDIAHAFETRGDGGLGFLSMLAVLMSTLMYV